MRKYIALVLVLVCVLSLVGCSSEPKTFEISGAEKLTVMSGSTGESIDITNADDIKYITDNINALKYSKGEKVNSDGWSYALQWFDENGESIENLTLLGDGYTIIYDGYYYKGMSIDYEIDLTFLDIQFAECLELPDIEPTDNTLEVMENTVAEIGRGTLKTAVELSEEDANILSQIINNGSWIEEPTDCESDCVINLKGHLTYYHSNSGTLNKYNLAEMSIYSSRVQEINGKSLVLSEEDRTTVNAILQKYITLGTDIKPHV